MNNQIFYEVALIQRSMFQTDHDPRNPSYIVTQGPLAQTVADFWQMIWEQGCVVIVMLSRLQDNGYQLCHRYWPEEGSEQYHIFEVRLNLCQRLSMENIATMIVSNYLLFIFDNLRYIWSVSMYGAMII